MTERCPRCKSEALEAHTIQYFQEFDGEYFSIENVSARICNQCGEIILSEPIAERIQEMIWAGTKPKRIQQVPQGDTLKGRLRAAALRDGCNNPCQSVQSVVAKSCNPWLQNSIALKMRGANWRTAISSSSCCSDPLCNTV